MGSALTETEELDHEDAVVATRFSLREEGVDIGSEAVLGLGICQSLY